MKISMIHKAFTLLELLVSVAVIGILASVSFAQYAEYKDKASKAVMINDAKSIMTAAEALRLDSPTTSIHCADPVGSSDGSCEELLPGFRFSKNTCGHLITNWGSSDPIKTYNGKINNNQANKSGSAYQLSFGDPKPIENNGGGNDGSFRWISKNMVFFSSGGMKWWPDCED